MSKGLILIKYKRVGQINVKGMTTEYDVVNNPNGELKQAVEALIKDDRSLFPEKWDDQWCDRMHNKTLVEKLAIAGSFCAAEIDRLTELEDRKLVESFQKKK